LAQFAVMIVYLYQRRQTMSREHWIELNNAIWKVQKTWCEHRELTHPTARIVRVHLWGLICDRPVSWACKRENWAAAPKADQPDQLPDQSTMSRRTRRKEFERFMERVGQVLSGTPARQWIKLIDGKALPVAAHSTDRNATWGRGAGQKARGYKLHMIWGACSMPLEWAVTGLHVVEKRMASRMVKRLEGPGYLLGDGHYDFSALHDEVAAVNHQLIAPRQHPGKGLGHHYQSEHRLRSIQTLEVPWYVSQFGKQLYGQRKRIEGAFGNLCSFGGGLTCLPAWVRRPWRVRHWVHGKLLVNAARINCLRRAQARQEAQEKEAQEVANTASADQCGAGAGMEHA
jgi:hypothetical protein